MDRTRNVHPPFYFLLEHGWVGLFGDSEFAARFLSALFGFFAILMIYKVGRLLFDKEVGLFASLLLALSTFHIRFSQEARSFSLMVLLTLISIYFLLKIQLGETRPWDSIAYALSTVLLIYTHYYGLFIVIAENLYVTSAPLLFKKEPRIHFQRWIFLQMSVILLFAPWIPILFKQFWRVQKKGGFSGAAVPSLEALYKTFWFYSGNRMLMALLVLLAFLSLATYSRKPRDSSLDKGLPAPREERPS